MSHWKYSPIAFSARKRGGNKRKENKKNWKKQSLFPWAFLRLKECTRDGLAPQSTLVQDWKFYFIFLFYNFLGDQMGLMIYLIVYLVMKTMVGCYGKKDVKCIVESGGQSFGKGKDISQKQSSSTVLFTWRVFLVK